MTQPMRRLDHDQRPELNFGTVDFAVTEEYWATQPVPRLEPSFASVPAAGPSKGTPRPPVPMRVVFAVEVTAEAVESGFAAASCEAIRSALYDEPQTAPSHVAIVTFDREICFYDLSVRVPLFVGAGLTAAQATLQQPHMLVVSDIEEVFVPLRDDLFVDPTQSRSMIESLLDSMPTRIFAQTTARASALLPALRSGLAALADTGGHLVAFAHSLPSHGPGALLPRTDESALHNTGKERELFVPRDRLWAALAEECAEAGVGASLVLGPRRFIDVGSIGACAVSARPRAPRIALTVAGNRRPADAHGRRDPVLPVIRARARHAGAGTASAAACRARRGVRCVRARPLLERHVASAVARSPLTTR